MRSSSYPSSTEPRSDFRLEEATIAQINQAFDQGILTSQKLVQLYLNRIAAYDQQGIKLGSVLSLNPDALETAAALDQERKLWGSRSPLHGIPVLLKDNIGAAELPTTAGAIALANSYTHDAFITQKLREAGAVILGKANLTEFAAFLSLDMPNGFSAVGGFTYNPYDPTSQPDGLPILDPGGSSSGSAVAVAANFVTVSVGTETSGSILYPASLNSVVGIKPTVGLLSREGIVPGGLSQDTAGPIARTVTDAAILLGAMTGVDVRDPATLESEGRFYNDYTPFLNPDSLTGVRIGVPKAVYWEFLGEDEKAVVEAAIGQIESLGATIVYEEIATAREEYDLYATEGPVYPVLSYEFKRDLNNYLEGLGEKAPVKTLAELIAFNNADPETRIPYGQYYADGSESLDLEAGLPQYLQERATDLRLAKDGLDAYVGQYDLDAILFPESWGASIGAKAGYPSITVPAGFAGDKPYGVTFMGTAYQEPQLLGFAYGFEQATLARRSPLSTPMLSGEVLGKPFGLSEECFTQAALLF
jgi:amidase